MIRNDVLKKIRHIQIHTKRAMNGLIAGNYRTRQKGFGMEFDQITDYQHGDDIRFVDWKSSARSNKLLIKQYKDERTRVLILIVDISASSFFGSAEYSKQETIAQIAGAIALVGQYCKDQVGLLLLSEEVEHFIPPRSGKKHIHTILNLLFTVQPTKQKTDLKKGFEFISHLRFKNALVLILSDFIDFGFKQSLTSLTKRHDVIAIRCTDQLESIIPFNGLLRIVDIETGERVIINTHKSSSFSAWNTQRIEEQNYLFRSIGVDVFDVTSQKSFIEEMILFLGKRRNK